MKKLFLTILFTMFLSGGASAEIVNLKCEESKTNTPINIILDTDIQQVSTQGSKYEPYLYKNGIFIFFMKTGNYQYYYRLNRNTGILSVKSYPGDKKDVDDLMGKLKFSMVLEKTTTKDTDYILNFLENYWEEKEPDVTFISNCDKTEKKF